ncbi:reticulocalbin-2 [Senna tora]|uniref:Reticulocalbin-2 n=1 Tax=Senna tora TaxID=362788 RepID=A0A834SVK3_9FABA|nr:reticulocalbin-2 [Senna tora]
MVLPLVMPTIKLMERDIRVPTASSSPFCSPSSIPNSSTSSSNAPERISTWRCLFLHMSRVPLFITSEAFSKASLPGNLFLCKFSVFPLAVARCARRRTGASTTFRFWITRFCVSRIAARCCRFESAITWARQLWNIELGSGPLGTGNPSSLTSTLSSLERDTDRDGKINFKEFFHGLFDLVRNYDEESHNSSHHSDNSMDAPARMLFGQLDKDSDGLLSDVELLPIIGKIHPSEHYYAKQQTDYIITQADGDKDGRLTLTEMIENPYVRAALPYALLIVNFSISSSPSVTNYSFPMVYNHHLQETQKLGRIQNFFLGVSMRTKEFNVLALSSLRSLVGFYSMQRKHYCSSHFYLQQAPILPTSPWLEVESYLDQLDNHDSYVQNILIFYPQLWGVISTVDLDSEFLFIVTLSIITQHSSLQFVSTYTSVLASYENEEQCNVFFPVLPLPMMLSHRKRH